MQTVCWAFYMDILNCFRYVKQSYNFIQPLVRLRTCWPWWSLLDADQEVLGWCLLGGAALEQCPWHCQPWGQSQRAQAARMGQGWCHSWSFLVSSALLPQELSPGEGSWGKCSSGCTWGALGCDLCMALQEHFYLLNAFLDDFQGFPRFLPSRSGVGSYIWCVLK